MFYDLGRIVTIHNAFDPTHSKGATNALRLGKLSFTGRNAICTTAKRDNPGCKVLGDGEHSALERRTRRDRKVASSNPGRSGGGNFLLQS